jgi:membrane-associated phospholipid phosphatase
METNDNNNNITNFKSPKGDLGGLFFNIISLVFQPLLMPTYGMILLMRIDIFSVQSSAWKLVAVIGTFVFTGILPAIPIYLLMRKGEVHDLFISKKEERTMPYLFSFMAYVFWALFMWRTLKFDQINSMYIVAMAMGSAASIFVIVLINIKWKISAHMAGIGGLTGYIFGVCYRTAINPVWFLVLILGISALVAISRIGLKAHTPGQTLAGFALGFAMVFLPCFLF